MPNVTAKASSNVFFQARCEAATHNDQLSSREGAAEIMSIDRGRLYRIENGLCTPYPDEIALMADLYGKPELRSYYCSHMCPLGADTIEPDVAGIDRITIQALSVLSRAEETKVKLLDITADGVISEDEHGTLKDILDNLTRMEKVTESLKLWIKKNL